MGCWIKIVGGRGRWGAGVERAEQRPRYATSGGCRLVMHCRRLRRVDIDVFIFIINIKLSGLAYKVLLPHLCKSP